MAGHRAQIWGAGLFLAAVLAALGIWFGAAGPVGEAMRDGADGAVGGARLLIPVLLAWIGALLVRGDHDDKRRIGLALLLGLVAATGIAHLVSRRSGGALGEVAAEPLAGVAGTLGAAVVLGALALAALLILT
jgi:DNA segregation ATPase FtsK/SpoIIIE, S-DNA-T family